LVTDADRFEELIVNAQKRYDEAPTDQRAINELADLLCRREAEAEENRAIGVLVNAYKQTEDYRFKSRAYDIRIKQKRRAERAARDAGDQEKHRKLKAESLQFELSVFKDRMKHYPTDLRYKYEFR